VYQFQANLVVKDEMLEGLEIFQSTYVNYKQRFIEELFTTRLARINQVPEEMTIRKYEINFSRIEGNQLPQN